MKLIITEEQLRLIIENDREKLFPILGSMINSEDDLDKFINLYIKNKDSKGYDGIKLIGEFDFSYYYTDSLGVLCNELVKVDGDLEVFNRGGIKFNKLRSVSGGLDLSNCKMKSLLELEYVGGGLSISRSKIESLPKLKEIGGSFSLYGTPLSETTTEEELREKINVEGEIYL